jgi:hypothetical protein
MMIRAYRRLASGAFEFHILLSKKKDTAKFLFQRSCCRKSFLPEEMDGWLDEATKRWPNDMLPFTTDDAGLCEDQRIEG